ncbi:MAG: class I SAM-dependent methyltransferase [Balneolaceae bacterium]|nr:class I SAM-dependent methyltransferase [Balneolaceae bacterium]
METITSERFFRIYYAKPDPQTIARQLRKPSGQAAGKVAAKMNEANAPLFDLTLETMQPANDESILEIGFGSGKFLGKLFEQAGGLQVSGIDYSQAMLDNATTHNRSLIDAGRLNLERGNSNDLPYPNGSFDKVFCNMVIYFWDQPGKHLSEVRRVLKPNGRFYTGMRAKSSMMKLPFIEHGFNVYEIDQWSSVLSANGFKVIDIIKELDPSTEIEGEEMRMESICIVAEKR